MSGDDRESRHAAPSPELKDTFSKILQDQPILRDPRAAQGHRTDGPMPHPVERGFQPMRHQRPAHRAPNAPEPDPAWWLRASQQSSRGRLWICAADRGGGTTRAVLEGAVERIESGQDRRVAVITAGHEHRRILANDPQLAPHLVYSERWSYEPSKWRATSRFTTGTLDYLSADAACDQGLRGHAYDLLVLDTVERFTERHLHEILSKTRGASVYASAADQLAPRTLDLLAWALDLGMSVSLTRPGDRESPHLGRHVAEELHRRIGAEQRELRDSAERAAVPRNIMHRGWL